jgi:RES domain-containing protein
VKAWRIATETRRYRADDLSGAGAARHPGRWNSDGEAVVYAASSIALAVLETAAHVDDAGLPLNRYLVEVDIPDDLWVARQTLLPHQLPTTWDAIPAGHGSVGVGSQWLQSLTSTILQVPSVIVPEELVVLVNPNRADARRIPATVVRRFEYDLLFRSSSRP